MLLDVPTTLMGTLTMEPGVVFLLWDCLPSRTFGLLFPPIGGMSGEGDRVQLSLAPSGIRLAHGEI